ncbi:hypothetical protein QH73_0006430 [Scytonema millei VB511283]|uniref:Uncharacterized protein n=2 Tax=Scytonema TaxID=1203 RepID=A0A9X5E3B3_9CYAN|nr:hypothetical protein [Scytonema millei VB511283]
MNETDFSPLEKAIAKKIDQTKSKATQPGYLRQLVAKLHLRIEAALARGCEYDDLAKSIAESGVKISAATLKQYHTEYRRQLEKEVGDNSDSSDSTLPPAVPVPATRKPEVAIKDANTQPAAVLPKIKQEAAERLFSNK